MTQPVGMGLLALLMSDCYDAVGLAQASAITNDWFVTAKMSVCL
ncbi:Uncharacterised protein [Moraxella ovis]|uniref:Uncharacterized protein n=1 Tax=Moraxella ovis TaxID=29433 RepID=A0A2X1T2A8_9GAMM|nr:hypothetical protein [Moraxella ovis]SPX84682.1 Uncharacterised protein [Moraxella ovis]SPX86880.1 Uncharacterised protein [Moraxella ovis]STY87658.1 Uncharacterised protein [Moraxella ovis]STZ05555.1 Uncharacterised protein [Moraxella ovis]